MLNPNLCSPISSNPWSAISWQVFDWLTKPSLVIPPILVIVFLPWLIRRLRWKRQISGFGVFLFLAYLTALSPIAVGVSNRVLISLLPSDSGAPADAIVVLGRGGGLRPQRVAVAADLWRSHRAPIVFASGRGDATEMGDLLETKGVPKSAIDGEPCSRTTEENARFTAAILQPQDVHRILLVTDPPHMLRSLLTFRSLGFEVIPHPNPLPQQMDRKQRAFLVFREYLGIVSYGLQGRFSPREASDVEVALASPPSRV